MNTLICLVRHGQTDWNKQFLIQGRYDIPLNDEGRKQIAKTILRLKNYDIKWDIFLSSPLIRAKETCEIIKKNLGYQENEIIIRNNLIEREFGEADGIQINDAVYARILKNDYANIETSIAISKRALDEIMAIDKAYAGKKVLVVTHSHFIKALFTQLDSTLTFQSFLANGALNFLEIKDGKVIRFAFNQ